MGVSALAKNMPFVVSLLWLLYHTVMFTIPLIWAFAYATGRHGASPPGGTTGAFDIHSPKLLEAGPAAPSGKPTAAAHTTNKGSFGCLGVYSYLAWAICWAAVLLVGIACVAIGGGTIGSFGVNYHILNVPE